MNCLEFQHPHLCVVLLFVNAKQHLAVLSFWGQESGSRTQGGHFSLATITLAADKPNVLINAHSLCLKATFLVKVLIFVIIHFQLEVVRLEISHKDWIKLILLLRIVIL